MRTDVAGVIIALVLAFAGMLSVCAQDAKESEVRKVDAFSSIEITSVGTIHFTQSDTYSFRIEGREKYVKNTETTVKDGRLLIGFKDKKKSRIGPQFGQLGVKIPRFLPQQQERTMPHRHRGLCAQKLIADPNGETALHLILVQRKFEPSEGDPFRCAAVAEHR